VKTNFSKGLFLIKGLYLLDCNATNFACIAELICELFKYLICVFAPMSFLLDAKSFFYTAVFLSIEQQRCIPGIIFSGHIIKGFVNNFVQLNHLPTSY